MLIVKMLFGSHLYGTSTPASDKDFKGVALPTWRQVALGRIPKHAENSSTGKANSKNTAEDIDIEVFGLHEFIKLACEGQTVAMDMLHAPSMMLIEGTLLWREIQRHRSKFYSRNIHSFIGYAMGQAAKYGVKGSRLNDAKAVLDWLDTQPGDARIAECPTDTFPAGEHIKLIRLGDEPSQQQFDVCGKKIQFTSRVRYAHEIVSRFYLAYGDRARKAAIDEGVDWKAVSHAVRAAYQMKELFTEGTITFPRPEAALLTDIKLGNIKYLNVAPLLEDLISEVKGLKDRSSFPENADRSFWDAFLVDVVNTHLVPQSDAA